MTKIIADIGATGSKFGVIKGGDIQYSELKGFNPYLNDMDVLSGNIDQLCKKTQVNDPTEVTEVRLFGAGFLGEKITQIENFIASTFPSAKEIEIGDDVLGTCKAVSPDEESMIVMMGTGTGHCYWDGSAIAKQVPALGFVLGDEGSGGHIGRDILTKGLFNKFTGAAQDAFTIQVQSYDDVASYINEPSTIATWAKFAKSYADDPVVQEVLRDNFDQLAMGIIKEEYDMLDKLHTLTGSIAVNFKEQVTAALMSVGISEDNIRIVSKPSIELLAPQYVT